MPPKDKEKYKTERTVKFHLNRYIQRLQRRIAQNRRLFVLYSVLRVLVILTGIRSFFTRSYESLMLCILSLLLFLLPSFFEDRFQISIPPLFQGIIYLFIYAAEILGEANNYYTAIPGWDTMLHTLNGFLCAAIGFSLVELLNRRATTHKLSPAYLSIMAFCFSMTVGVLWEFFEFSMDQIFYLDMQKDFLVRTFGSVKLDPSASQIPFRVSNITRTIIETSGGGRYVIEGGYLDIGIIDSMKDLQVNFIGAVVFSVLGYFYVKNYSEIEDMAGNRKSLAASLLIHNLTEDEVREQEQALEDDSGQNTGVLQQMGEVLDTISENTPPKE